MAIPSVAILGAGSMGRAILSGLVAAGADDVRVTTRSAASAESVSAPAGWVLATEAEPAANRLAVGGAKVVIVAVKPYLVREVLAEAVDTMATDAVVVSVAAGVTTAAIEAGLPASVAVVRAMPNTPARIGRGVTGVSAGSRATADDVALVRSLFETVGTVVEVPEEKLDALSTISGSGPAYVFFLIEQLTATAVAKGFTPEEAARLVEGTFLGAVELLAATGTSPAELRRQVTSPNGTTERALAALADADLKGVFDRATDAALARARELAQG